MSRAVLPLVVAAGVVLGAVAGCFNANVRVPDVQVNVPSEYGGGSSNERRMPYAKELEKVIGQQKSVEKELKARDWEDLSDEVSDWVNYTRKLMGKADTSRNPAKMKEYCAQLLKDMEAMQRTARAHDAKGSQAALERIDPWLNRLSAEFPLSEPKPDAPSGAKAKGAVAP
jgi:hypothetical protein